VKVTSVFTGDGMLGDLLNDGVNVTQVRDADGVERSARDGESGTSDGFS
jgi:hypothetical protein